MKTLRLGKNRGTKERNDAQVELFVLRHSWKIALPRGYARKFMVVGR